MITEQERRRRLRAANPGLNLDEIAAEGTVLRVPMILADHQPQETTMTTGLADAAMIDAEAQKPHYDAFRGRVHRDGTPLDQHFARMNLARGGAAGENAAAAHNAMVRGHGEAWRSPPASGTRYRLPDELVATLSPKGMSTVLPLIGRINDGRGGERDDAIRDLRQIARGMTVAAGGQLVADSAAPLAGNHLLAICDAAAGC